MCGVADNPIEICGADLDQAQGWPCLRRVGHDGEHDPNFRRDFPIDAYPYYLSQHLRTEATGQAPSPPDTSRSN